MFPMDGGRILQCLLWRSIGWRRSMFITCNIGLVCAIAVAVWSVVGHQPILLGIALMAGLTCYQQRQILAATDPAMDEQSPFAESLAWREHGGNPRGGRERDTSAAAVKRDEATREQARRDGVELDRILAKIAKDGMGTLSRKERAFLTKETHRKRID